jgi:hypothetical protein
MAASVWVTKVPVPMLKQEPNLAIGLLKLGAFSMHSADATRIGPCAFGKLPGKHKKS